MEAILIFIQSDWSWSLEQDLRERHWGCLLLCRYGDSLSFSELCCRIHPIYVGYAVHCRGMQPEELQNYADRISTIWASVYEQTEATSLNYSSALLTARIEDSQDLINLHLISVDESQFSRSISYTNPDSFWGGVSSEDVVDPFDLMSSSDKHRRDNQDQIIQSIQEQQRSGNFWIGERFLSYALPQIVNEKPDLVDQWLNAAFVETAESSQFLCRANSFYESLCGVLLECKTEQGVRLYWRLQQLDTKIRIQDDQLKLEWIDYALFKATPTALIEEAWQKKLERCLTDGDLLKLTVLAELGNGHNWLWLTIEQGLGCLQK